METRVSHGLWPLTAREVELEAFSAAWAGNTCRGVVIFGAAGTGKSRLAEACFDRVVAKGWKGQRIVASAATAVTPLGALAALVPPNVELSDPVVAFAQVKASLPARLGRQSVLWVDDMHLLDAASAVLLRQLLEAGVVRLVGTIRTGEPLGTIVAAITGPDSMFRIDLGNLSRKRCESVLQAALGGPLSQRTLQQLHKASGGNLLYLRELTIGALNEGNLVSDGGPWELNRDSLSGTPRLAELIRARLDAYGASAGAVLELLAVCGAVSMPDALSASSLQELEGLEEAGIVQVAVDHRRTTIRFAHPLYAETVVSGLSTQRRQQLLLQQVERIEAHGARRREDALQIATWRLSATGTADPDLLLEAAALARHAGDYAQAVGLAGAAWRERPDPAAALGYASVLIELVRHDEAERVLQETMGKADVSERAALEELQVRNAILRGNLLEAQNILETRCDPQSRLSLGMVFYFRGRFHETLDCVRSLEGEAGSATATDAAIFAGAAFSGLGLPDNTRRVLAPLRRDMSESKEDQGGISLVSDFLEGADAYAVWCQGYLDSAEATLSRLYDEAVAKGEIEVAAKRALSLAEVYLEKGKVRSVAKIVHSIATQAVHWDLFTQYAQALAVICAVVLNRAEDAQRYLRLLPPPGDNVEACYNRIARAWFAQQRCDKAQVTSLLVEAAMEARDLGQGSHSVWVVHAMGRMGVAEAAAPFWELDVQGEYLNSCLAYTRAIACKDVTLLQQVAEYFSSVGANLYAAEAFAEVSQWYTRRGDPRRAAAAQNRAAARLAHCEGALTPPLGHLEIPATATPLTAREREICMLAMTGTPSKEIAASLFISPRTVDNHLQRAYTKLGISHRRRFAEVAEQI
ncbi:LuxR C-terminal-related transcriptional regulator [Streptomyces sp. NPDC002952]|uniref:LuxR C-terminal-related transcriptional regulator n=1 Tax=Streptomyces sp. NPDC002952 TaxID=3364673 RepID=UPI00367F1B78